ncbi:ABC transporter substrate-binding protein [Candidatus Gracilibacteria bacterium]|nr:ABC transporter substrate-binding protein [Candidatus Gracilibacteria bacterium]
MGDIVVKKVKKYVLFISIVFFLILGSHLTYAYLYADAESEPIEGGTITEAIIGNFPHFNPLVASSDHNAYINDLLYRSMLQYSTSSENLETNLVSCNLENLLYIECVLESNLNWSDGSPITTDDIKATLDIIIQTKVNPILASLLAETTIETTKDSISFKNVAKDINFLDVFLQPIIPKSVIETLDTENVSGNFSDINGIYSGRFILSNISVDDTIGVTKITLGRNEAYFGNDMYIQFLILNLFENEDDFLKNRNSFNIFNDREGLIGDSIPRLDVYEYTLPQFVTSFFNIETLESQDFRSFISRTLSRQTIIENVGREKVIPAYNPFLTQQNIDGEDDTLNLANYLQERGYTTKAELLANTESEIAVVQAERDEILAQEQALQEELISNEATLFAGDDRPEQQTLTTIIAPTTQKYNFISEDNFLLQGNVPSGVEAVFINDYQLQGFAPGSSVFNYRVSEEFGTISEGENNYSVYFQRNGERQFIEEVVFIYNRNSTVLEATESGFFRGNTTASSSLENETTNTNNALPNLSRIQNLDERFYYDAAGNPFTLKIVYAQTDSAMEKTAETLTEMFNAKGIQVSVDGLSLSSITEKLRDETLKYDIMIIGINLGFFDSDIFPYFHSSQVDKGYNFSNYQKLSLDILLEELKSNNLTPSKKDELKEKMLNILSEENITKVLYTPKVQLLADKNIKNFNFPENLPDSRMRYYPLLSTYLEEKKIVNTENKGVTGFIQYLTGELF